MKQQTIQELNKLYSDADDLDKAIFADQRSNLQLVAGEHYSKKNSHYWNRIRDSKELSSDQKVRLTKNHIYKISKIRRNILLSHAAGIGIVPSNESELQDQKSAELNKAVWNYGKEKLGIKKRVHEWAKEYFDIGEVAIKMFWDPRAGRFLGYKQKLDEMGQPVMDEMGQPVAGEEAIFSGDLVLHKVYGFNLLRHPNAKTMDESPVLIIRSAVQTEELMRMFGDDEEKSRFIVDGKDDTYVIFDSVKQSYSKEKGVMTLREYYYRPCPEMPNGYYYITVEGGVLAQGELPFGIFPILYQGHDEIETSPRHRSPIKQLRPCQIEINRAASKVAEHHITLGDDKLVLVNGSKVSKGSDFPGIRTMTVTGQAPVIIGGRTGEQYLQHIATNIQEIYELAQIPESMAEKSQGDPWGELFKSVKQKKNFIIDAEKFAFFLVDVCKLYLDLAKNYFDDTMLVEMVGRNERINISEFKNTKPQCYQIKVEPLSEDMETMMGKQLMLNHVLQYSGGQLNREDIGKLVRLMPYANNEKAFDDMTLNYDRATNLILALDRGDAPAPSRYDDGPYVIKRLTARQVQSDFAYLDQAIQQNYELTVKLYEELEADKMAKIQAANADFIPTDGPSIKVAWYIKDPTNSARSIQATLPANAINWLVKRLEDQGTNQQQLEGIKNQGVLAEIAQQFKQGQIPQGSGGLPKLQGGLV